MSRTLPESERKSQILDAALRCIARRGYAETHMEDIAREAGLSKGGLYFHFGSKHELLVALVRRENAIVSKLVEEALAADGTVEERVTRLTDALLAHLRHRMEAGRLSQSLLDVSLRHPDLAALVQEGESIFLGHVRRMIELAAARGECPSPPDAEAVAALVLIQVEGFKTKFLHFPEWPWPRLLPLFRDHLLSILRSGGSIR